MTVAWVEPDKLSKTEGDQDMEEDTKNCSDCKLKCMQVPVHIGKNPQARADKTLRWRLFYW